MGDHFTALSVGKGDAFLYNRNDRSFLVDGGANQDTLPRLVENNLYTDRLNVVVCTHNDSDHANGLIGLFDGWGYQIDELWLPGSWSDRLADMVRSPQSFVEELIFNTNEIASEIGLPQDLETIGKKLKGDRIRSERGEPADYRRHNNYFLENIFDEIDPELVMKRWHHFKSLADIGFRSCPLNKIYSSLFNFNYISVINELINAGERIVKLASLAYENGTRVRWFYYTNTGNNSGGLPNYIIPMNSREIIPSIRPRTMVNALQYLALTTVNVESLVFWAPETERNPGVLFSAESDFSFKISQPRPTNSIIATAPHHGSDANSNVYNKVETWHKNPNQITWVRSDTRTTKRPGNAYKNVSGRKFCTLCNPVNGALQYVYLNSRRIGKYSIWAKGNGVRDCDCK